LKDENADLVTFSLPTHIFSHIKMSIISAVSVRMVESHVKSLDRDFKEKSEEARIAIVRRFVRKHRYGIRVGTHVAQQNPAKTQELAADFV
jgi:hypothetical protein